jgi:hypothetical protein
MKFLPGGGYPVGTVAKIGYAGYFVVGQDPGALLGGGGGEGRGSFPGVGLSA